MLLSSVTAVEHVSTLNVIWWNTWWWSTATPLVDWPHQRDQCWRAGGWKQQNTKHLHLHFTFTYFASHKVFQNYPHITYRMYKIYRMYTLHMLQTFANSPTLDWSACWSVKQHVRQALRMMMHLVLWLEWCPFLMTIAHKFTIYDIVPHVVKMW